MKLYKAVGDGVKVADIVVFESGACAIYAHVESCDKINTINGAKLHSDLEVAVSELRECIGNNDYLEILPVDICNDKMADKIVSLTFALIESYKALRHAIEVYGRPGGPWNVPSSPGCWIANAKAAVKAIKDALVDRP